MVFHKKGKRTLAGRKHISQSISKTRGRAYTRKRGKAKSLAKKAFKQSR